MPHESTLALKDKLDRHGSRQAKTVFQTSPKMSKGLFDIFHHFGWSFNSQRKYWSGFQLLILISSWNRLKFEVSQFFLFYFLFVFLKFGAPRFDKQKKGGCEALSSPSGTDGNQGIIQRNTASFSNDLKQMSVRARWHMLDLMSSRR